MPNISSNIFFMYFVMNTGVATKYKLRGWNIVLAVFTFVDTTKRPALTFFHFVPRKYKRQNGVMAHSPRLIIIRIIILVPYESTL